MRRLALAVIALAGLILLAVALSPHRQIVTTIRIAAPPPLVWAVLTDIAAYPAWNPHMRLHGTLSPGAVIEHVEGDGKDAMTFWPTVLAVRPDQELRWRGQLQLPGLFDAEHYFLLRPDDGGTLFTQGETFHGVVLWLYDVEKLRPTFTDLNDALKKRAETAAAHG
jgi:hypothetical protein